MFSGTESPLVAMNLISECLERSGQSSLRVKHAFSCEIEEFKQAFIERNFQPGVMFRDAREFIDGFTATTAYGANVPIPGDLDILVAGFVCKDLSYLNSRQKGLDDGGESGDTWRALHSYVRRFRPRMVLVENVKASKDLWDRTIQEEWKKIDYSYTWTYLDTKDYYLPQTRQRMYMFAIDNHVFKHNKKNALITWRNMMDKLQRRCSSPFEAFLDDDSDFHTYDHFMAIDWGLCRLRHYMIRENEGLGWKRPITNWSKRINYDCSRRYQELLISYR